MLFAQERWSSTGISCWCIVDSSNTVSIYPLGPEYSAKNLLDRCETGTDRISEYLTISNHVYPFTCNPLLPKQDDTTPLRLETLRKFGEDRKYEEEFNRKLYCWHGINSDIDMSDFYPKPEYGWTIPQTGQEVQTIPSHSPYRNRNVDESELLRRQIRESPYGGRWHASPRCTKCGHTYISSELRYRCDECGGQEIHNTTCDG